MPLWKIYFSDIEVFDLVHARDAEEAIALVARFRCRKPADAVCRYVKTCGGKIEPGILPARMRKTA